MFVLRLIERKIENMKRFLPILLALALLCACGAPAPVTDATTEATQETTAAPTTEPATEVTTEPVTDPTEVTTEEPAMSYYNPLNGEALTAPYVGRVFAVTINNVEQALPHHGLTQADIFFEMFINDYATRGLALFSNVAEVESIGSIRSTRYNFTDLALAYNLILCHASASDAVLSDMYSNGVDNMNVDGAIGYRDSYRYDVQGYDWEHCLFLDGEDAIEAAQDKDFDLEVSDKDYGMIFAEDGTPASGEGAAEVKIVFTLDGRTKTTKMVYDEEIGKYVYYQYGDMMVDENNNEPEAFTNVIVILAETENVGVYHVADLYGEGEGYYACGGKIVKIKWVHEEETDPITFFMEDGSPLQQGIGSSYIAIAPTESSVEY